MQWPFTRARWTPTRDRGSEVLRIQKEALAITSDIRKALDELDATLQDPAHDLSQMKDFKHE